MKNFHTIRRRPIKEHVLIIEEYLKKIQSFYHGWTFAAHNSLWNEIDNLKSALDWPLEGRNDGALSYIVMENDCIPVWRSIAQTIYEAYCKRFGILPLDFWYITDKRSFWQMDR